MPYATEPIAVIGVSALFPGSRNAHGFWRDILAGRDLIRDVPASRWLIEDHYDPDPSAKDKTYCRRGAFLDPVDFDPMEFGIPPAAIAATDTSQLLALIVAKQVLEDALGTQFQEVDRSRASVILGVTSGQELICEAASRLQRPVWLKALRESGIPEAQAREVCERIADSYTPWQENTFPGLLGNVVAGRIANRFDLGGANFITDAACASSLSAVSVACGELQLRSSDLVIAGGVDTFNDIPMFVCFSKTPALSPTGDCRPFSSEADGTILGEGLAMVALKRLSDAERDGNRIYAVIKGVGSSSDGRSGSIYAPVPEGQARALRRAYEIAGYGPGTVEMVEAHGTATAAGDAAEFAALQAVFEPEADGRTEWCALGSVKSQVGHTKAAAGAAGLFKTVMALHHKVLPPTLKAREPNPSLRMPESPFYLAAAARPWIRGADHPRRASLSSFGFGGTNFHIAFEEYTGAGAVPALRWTAASELLPFSADTAEALADRLRDVAGLCGKRPAAAIAREAQRQFATGKAHRIAIVAESAESLAADLRRAAASLMSAEPKFGPNVYYGHAERAGKTAFLFPGQSSQYVGMTADLAMNWPQCREVWDQASDLARVVFPVPASGAAAAEAQKRELTRTENAQPAIGAAAACILQLLRAAGITADVVAGHSFGEVTALYAGGACTLETMLRIARERGELMAKASVVPAGMLSVRSDAASLRQLIGSWGLELTVANCNGPAQTVLSGPESAIVQAKQRLEAMGIAATRLDVSTAFHSPLMRPAAERFRQFLESAELSAPRLPFYSNLRAASLEGSASECRDAIGRLISEPVRFEEMIRAMHADGVRTFIEVGPSGVLTSLVRSILTGQEFAVIACDRNQTHGVTGIWHALGQLVAGGFELNWSEITGRHEAEPETDADRARFTLRIDGGNYARPYPPPGGAAALPKPVSAPVRGASSPPLRAAAPDAAAGLGDNALEAYRVFQESITTTHRLWQDNLNRGHREVTGALQSAYFSLMGQPVPQFELPAVPQIAAPEPARFEPVILPAPTPVLADPPPTTKLPEPKPAVAASGVRATLWAVVAEKTGYPEEMLQPEMALEADLGIDSIKRVEIFSAMQERYAAAGDFDQAALSNLRTLDDIVRWVDGLAGAAAALLAAASPEPMETLHAVMALIAEKTGYPVEMLAPEMALEGDLGIDSIKRVEIFSALQDAYPEAANVDQATLVHLRTIADVIAWLANPQGAETPHPVAPPPRLSPRLPRFQVTAMPAMPTGHNMLDSQDGPIAVVGGDQIGRSLAHVLSARGFRAVYEDVLPEGCRALICLHGLSPSSSAAESLTTHLSVFECAKAIAPHVREHAGAFVTVQDTGGRFAPVDRQAALSGGLTGIAKTAAHEWAGCRVKAIDIETAGQSPGQIAAALADELLAGGPEIEAGLRASGERFTLTATEATLSAGRLPLDDGAFVVATGGARGVTAACLLELARAVRLRILLLGRTSLEPEPAFCHQARTDADLKRAFLAQARIDGQSLTPADISAAANGVIARREIRENLAALRARGSEVRYEAVDVRDEDQVRAVIEQLRGKWGPVAGIVHGAGVLADRTIQELTAEQFRSVFETKVAGLMSLLSATDQDPLKLVALFSSIAGRCGNPGQCAYSAANEVLNRLARAEAERRGSGTKVTALNWGPWDGGMVTPALRRQFEERGIEAISIDDGARLFVDELRGAADEAIEVVLGARPVALVQPLRIVISRSTFPIFDDHSIQETPVFPVVGALELFLRATGSTGGAAFRDVKVLRGIRLHHFDNGGDPLTVQAGREERIEIVGPDGVRHYEARPLRASDGAGALPSLGTLAPAPWTAQTVYGDLLFHGPAFQSIQAIDGVSDAGIRGRVIGMASLEWPDTVFRSDGAMLDGGLQLARLWGYRAFGKPSLPTAIGEVHLFEAAEAGSAVCEVLARRAGPARFECDIRWMTDAGRILAVMRAVEMHTLAEHHA